MHRVPARPTGTRPSGEGTDIVDVRRAVVVDDDRERALLTARVLRAEGFEVALARTGPGALAQARQLDPDVVVLAVELPGMDGIEVLRRLRETSDCFVIMVDGADELDLVVTLELGADDYLARPFSPRELRARLSALLRRPRTAGTGSGTGRPDVARHPDIDVGGGLVVRPDRREVVVGGTVVPLTRTEFDLVSVLADHLGCVCARTDLLHRVWDSDYPAHDHLVDVHVANVRQKLRALAPHEWIRTVRGIGYRLDPVVQTGDG